MKAFCPDLPANDGRCVVPAKNGNGGGMARGRMAVCRINGNGEIAFRMGNGGKSLSGKGKTALFTDLSTENGDKAAAVSLCVEQAGWRGRCRVSRDFSRWHDGDACGAATGSRAFWAVCGDGARGRADRAVHALADASGSFVGYGFCAGNRDGGAKAPRLCGRGTGNGVICRVCPFCRFWRRRPGFPCGSCGF